jgi:transglutaminase-like putative cysteine protease
LPARLLVGRGALSAKPDNNMMYVKAEFFAAGVGWVPVDVNYNRFGDDEANFIVLHVDTDVVLDVPREKRKLEWFHFIHVGPTQGKGKPDGAVVKEDWLVKELRQP